MAEVAEGLARQGIEISQPYLSLLRSGGRANPNSEIVAALATYFGVSPICFYGADHTLELHQYPDWLFRMRDSKVREIAARSYARSDNSRQVIADMVDHLRKVDHISDEHEPNAG